MSENGNKALEDIGGIGAAAIEIALKASAGPQPIVGQGRVTRKVAIERGVRLASLGLQVEQELTVIAHEDQFARDMGGASRVRTVCDGSIDEGPDGGIGVTAGAGERTGKGKKSKIR